MDKFYPPNFIGYIPLPDGKPAAGGTLIACRTGTDILAPIYDENGVRIDGSALQIDSHGQAHFLLDPEITYRIKIIMPPNDILQPTAVYDNVRVASGGGGGGMENPMTAEGDMIKGGPSGAPERMAIGPEDSLLQSDGDSPEWRESIIVAGTMAIANRDGASNALSVEAGDLDVAEGNIYAKGNIRTSQGDMRCLGNIVSQEGTISATDGDVTAGGVVTGAGGVVSGANVQAVGYGLFGDGIIISKATAPASPSAGQVYYNTTDGKLYCYDGAQWNEVGAGGGGGMTNPMDGVGQMIYGFTGGTPYKLSAPSDNQQVMGVTTMGLGSVPDWKPAGNILVKALAQKYDGSSSGFTKGSIIYGGDDILVGEAGVKNKAEAMVLPIGTEGQALFVDSSGVPAWKNLPATMQENFSLLNSTNDYDTSSRNNRIFASKCVSNFTAKRTKLGFFHKSGTLGSVLLGIYDNSGNLLAQTAPFTPDSSTLEQVCWEDTLASFQMIAGEEYWFVAYFTENNWQLNIDALGMEKSSAFDVNFIASASANALTALPATLPAMTYETLAFYVAAK